MRKHSVLILFVSLMLIVPLYAAISFGTVSSWNIQTVGEIANSGGYLALDLNNNPQICYNIYQVINRSTYDRTWDFILTSGNGSSWSERIIENATCLDVVLDTHDNPQILYKNRTRGEIMTYANWTDKIWDAQVFYGGGYSGSLALDLKGFPHVAYIGDGSVKYAYWNGTEWRDRVVDANVMYEGTFHTHIGIDANDTIHIMYTGNLGYNTSIPNIKYAVGTNSNWNIQTIFEGCTLKDMTLDSKGEPHIVYFNGTLVYTYWDKMIWNTISFPTPPEDYDYGTSWKYDDAAIALDVHDKPIVVYLKMLRGFGTGSVIHATLTENKWSFETIDSEEVIGLSSVALDSKGTPHVSYFAKAPDRPLYGSRGQHLKYATPVESAPTTDQHLLIAARVIVVIVSITIIYLWKRKTANLK